MNIYNSLKNVFQDLIKENRLNYSFIPLLLVFITIPLSYAINNIALGFYSIIVLVTFRKGKIHVEKNLIFPIILYLLMVVSSIWSIDRQSTLSALSKEISLLIIPILFLFSTGFSKEQKEKTIRNYSYFIVFFTIFYCFRAIIRYVILHDSRVFFYHGENNDDYGLVPKLLNAIHVSVFVAIAFFHFFTKKVKTITDNFSATLLFLFILLLSSKNLILIVILLTLSYVFFFSKTAHKMRLRNSIIFGALIALVFSAGKIKSRFQEEFQSNSKISLSSNVINGTPNGVHYVSIKEAWTNPVFTPNDYFPGTAFRVYQFRVFTELITENKILFTGLGLNASMIKIKEKAIHYNLYMGNATTEGYQTKNFHNQYVQNFAELGLIGFLLLILLLIINIKNALKSKDFIHFAFSILMISLFLTESFLWRQRGVVFFTVMYCLFNSKNANHNS